MNVNPEDPATVALRRFRDRVTFFCQQYAYDIATPQAEDWPTVITREAAVLAQDGPDAYLRYVAHLDDIAAQAAVDIELRGILDGHTKT